MHNEQPKKIIQHLLNVFEDHPELKDIEAYKDIMGIMIVKPFHQVIIHLHNNVPRTFVKIDELQEYADRLYKEDLVNYMLTKTT